MFNLTLSKVLKKRQKKIFRRIKVRYVKVYKIISSMMLKSTSFKKFQVITKLKNLLPKYKIRNSIKIVNKMTSQELDQLQTPEELNHKKLKLKFENYFIRKHIFGRNKLLRMKNIESMRKSACILIFNNQEENLKTVFYILYQNKKEFENNINFESDKITDKEKKSDINMLTDDEELDNSHSIKNFFLDEEEETQNPVRNQDEEYENNPFFDECENDYVGLEEVGEEEAEYMDSESLSCSLNSIKNKHSLDSESKKISIDDKSNESSKLFKFKKMGSSNDSQNIFNSPEPKKQIFKSSNSNVLIDSHVFDIRLSNIHKLQNDEHRFIDEDYLNFTNYDTGT